jgi:hypothetical protein
MMLTYATRHAIRVAAMILAMTALLSMAKPAMASPSSIHPVSEQMCADMKRQRVLPDHARLTCSQLRLIEFSYIDFAGVVHADGQIMVMTAAAAQVQAIFDALLLRRFPIARARLMQHYQGDDDASMRHNNTSSFNHRLIKDGNKASLHAYGLAIDVNPLQNPYIQRHPKQGQIFYPEGGRAYARRPAVNSTSAAQSGMAEAVVDLFAEHGFTQWGGDWRQPIDYQHFQVNRPLAEKMAALSNEEAQILFAQSIARYRQCRHNHPGHPDTARRECARLLEQAG